MYQKLILQNWKSYDNNCYKFYFNNETIKYVFTTIATWPNVKNQKNGPIISIENNRNFIRLGGDVIQK